MVEADEGRCVRDPEPTVEPGQLVGTEASLVDDAEWPPRVTTHWRALPGS
jgi:hypothetical protein